MARSRRPATAGLPGLAGPWLRAGFVLLLALSLTPWLPGRAGPSEQQPDRAEPGLIEPPPIEPAVLQPAVIDPADYVLGPGDQLSLSFLDPGTVPLGGGFTIEDSGSASLPLLGSVQLAGLSVSQAARWLGSIYARSLPRPDLHLTLVAPRPLQVTVLGEVLSPGLHALPATATPLTAIVHAGGLTSRADRTLIVRRPRQGEPQSAEPGPSGAEDPSGADEMADTFLVDLAELLVGAAGPAAGRPAVLRLRSGDILSVGRGDGPIAEALLPLTGERLQPAAPLWSNLRLDGRLPRDQPDRPIPNDVPPR